MKDFIQTSGMRSFAILWKSIRKAVFPCCKKKRSSLTYLLRPTKPSTRPFKASPKGKKMNPPLSKKPANNNIIKQPLLSEIVELKPERFHLDIENYPLNQLMVTGDDHRKLVMKVTSMKLFAEHNQNKNHGRDNGLAKMTELGNNNNNYKQQTQVNQELRKYYKSRYLLFSLFDHGIKMDEEAWFSTTPEVIAEYLAKRLGSGVILDGFCGVGGNAIQFAKYCQSVIANDIDPVKISYARHNSRIYEVEAKMKLTNNDFLALELLKEDVDVVFLAPPWGGIEYSTEEDYSLIKSVRPNIMNIMEKTWSLTEKVILCLPRNINVQEIVGILVESAEKSGCKIERASVEIEKIYLNNKFKLNLVYFGNASKISKSIEYNKIYERVLLENTEKNQKGFSFKDKELVKKFIEKVGMVKMLNLADYAQKRRGAQTSLEILCNDLINLNLISKEEMAEIKSSF